MPRRSIWKGSFVDAFLSRMKKKESLMSRKFWSRRCRNSLIAPYSFTMGKSPVRCQITEGKVGHKLGEFASTRRRENLIKKSGNRTCFGSKN